MDSISKQSLTNNNWYQKSGSIHEFENFLIIQENCLAKLLNYPQLPKAHCFLLWSNQKTN